MMKSSRIARWLGLDLFWDSLSALRETRVASAYYDVRDLLRAEPAKPARRKIRSYQPEIEFLEPRFLMSNNNSFTFYNTALLAPQRITSGPDNNLWITFAQSQSNEIAKSTTVGT